MCLRHFDNFFNKVGSLFYSINILKYRHEHTAKLDIEVINKIFSQGISMRYSSFMKNVDKIFTSPAFAMVVPGVNESRLNSLKGDFIMDYRLSYNLNEKMTLSFIINNIFNKIYQSRPCSMMPMRNMSCQFRINL